MTTEMKGGNRQMKTTAILMSACMTVLLVSGLAAAMPILKTTDFKANLTCKKGDMNNDNVVDNNDVQPFLKVFGKSKEDVREARWNNKVSCADMNNDGIVNISDLGMLLAKIN